MPPDQQHRDPHVGEPPDLPGWKWERAASGLILLDPNGQIRGGVDDTHRSWAIYTETGNSPVCDPGPLPYGRGRRSVEECKSQVEHNIKQLSWVEVTTPSVPRPSHLKGPGEVHDSKGVPIYPGDLLRTFHFQTRKGSRIYYLYHVVCLMQDEKTGHPYLRMVPAHYLDPSTERSGGDPILSQAMVSESEVIHGHGGPRGENCFTDRVRVKLPKPEPETEE